MKRKTRYFIKDYGFLIIIIFLLILFFFGVEITMKINLGWILRGLILNFVGSFILVISVLFFVRMGKTNFFVYHPYDDNRKKILRTIQRKDKVDSLRISKEEVTSIIALILIFLGFLFQIVGNI